jgi:hydroxyacylglutathione hydrolase
MPAEVRKIGPLGPYDNNAYVIVDGETKQSIFVDAPFESERALDAAKDTKVQRIVVTHRHGDHWANIDLVKDKLGVPVMCHEADRAPYERKVDATVADNDALSIGETLVRVIHTPGHTPGSVCLLVGAADPPVLISGDTLFPGGPGRSDSAPALQEMIVSIRTLLLTLDDRTLVYPGHGANTTIGHARREVAAFDAREHPADLHGDVTWEG